MTDSEGQWIISKESLEKTPVEKWSFLVCNLAQSNVIYSINDQLFFNIYWKTKVGPVGPIYTGIAFLSHPMQRTDSVL